MGHRQTEITQVDVMNASSTTTRSCRDPGMAVIHFWLSGGDRHGHRPRRVTSHVRRQRQQTVDTTRYGWRRC